MRTRCAWRSCTADAVVAITSFQKPLLPSAGRKEYPLATIHGCLAHVPNLIDPKAPDGVTWRIARVTTPAAPGRATMLLPRELTILQHALGTDQYGRGTMFRNHFCAGGWKADKK